MAAKKKKSSKKKSANKSGHKQSASARSKAVARSAKEVTKAQKNLDLKIKKHKQTLTAMFFME